MKKLRGHLLQVAISQVIAELFKTKDRVTQRLKNTYGHRKERDCISRFLKLDAALILLSCV